MRRKKSRERRQHRNETTYPKGRKQTVLKKSELHGTSFSQARSRVLATRYENRAVRATRREAVTSRSPSVRPSVTHAGNPATVESSPSLAPNLI